MKRLLTILLIIAFLSSILTGCGTVSDAVSNSYPLENIIQSEIGSGTAYIYRAKDSSVSEIVNVIKGKYQPMQVSKEDAERMFLVYNDYLITVMKDIQEPNDALIEVANREFVKDNYDLSFFEAYLLVNIIEDVFEAGYKAKKYRGYTGPGGYSTYGKGTKTYNTTVGSVRTGSVGNTSPRGGGPGVGK